MASLDVAFVKYYNEALSNAYLTMPQRIINLFPIQLYAKLIITNPGALNWHFMDDGTGRYVSDTEFNLGLIDANSVVESKVPLEGALPSETTKETFSMRIELYKDDTYTQLYATNNNTINVHMYIQQPDASWGSSSLTEEEVVYKIWKTPIGGAKYGTVGNPGHTASPAYANTTDGLYMKFWGVSCTTNDYELGFTDEDSPLGVYSGVGAGWISRGGPCWKGFLQLYDYTNGTYAPFENKFISMTMTHHMGDSNVTGGLQGASITLDTDKVYKLVVKALGSWVGLTRVTNTSSKEHMVIGDIVVFNPLP